MVERYRKNRETGQATVEWALVFPIFLLLVFGIIDFSWLGYQRLMFESSFQMTAWDFALKKPMSDEDIYSSRVPPSYSTSSPNVVSVGGGTYIYALGDGIKKHMLESSLGFLEEDNLTVVDASAEFKINEIEDRYLVEGETIRVDSYQLQVTLEGDLEYKVKLLTPVGRIFNPNGEVILEKKLIRERTERVVVKRRVVIPASSE